MPETIAVSAPVGDQNRRDFLILATAAVGAAGAAASLVPLVHSMNPAADTLSLASIEVDLAPIEVGQSVTVAWRGKPVFIRHRTAAEIAAAVAVDPAGLRDPATDAQRVIQPEWLIVVGICTHLGCVPNGQKNSDYRGEFGGWFCPCHGSQYDTAGRARKGPAPRNLPVPPYRFVAASRVAIG
jgi:ubiquinol-cytochrome c reductase iron-sulfur subunit